MLFTFIQGLLPDKFEENAHVAFIMEWQQCLVININPISPLSSLVHPYSDQHNTSHSLLKIRHNVKENSKVL